MAPHCTVWRSDLQDSSLGERYDTRPRFVGHLTKGDNRLFNLMTRQTDLSGNEVMFLTSLQWPYATGVVEELNFISTMHFTVQSNRIVKGNGPLTLETLTSLSVEQHKTTSSRNPSHKLPVCYLQHYKQTFRWL